MDGREVPLPSTRSLQPSLWSVHGRVEIACWRQRTAARHSGSEEGRPKAGGRMCRESFSEEVEVVPNPDMLMLKRMECFWGVNAGIKGTFNGKDGRKMNCSDSS